MPILEIELDDEVAARLESLFADHRDWDEATRWNIVLHDGIDLTLFADEESKPQSIAREDRHGAEREAQMTKRKQQWLKTVDEGALRSARALAGNLPDDDPWAKELDRRPGGRVGFDISLSGHLARTAAWLSAAYGMRYRRESFEGFVVDLAKARWRRQAEQYVLSALEREFSSHWSELVWQTHPLLYKAGDSGTGED